MLKRFFEIGGKLSASLERYSPAGILFKANRARAASDWAEAARGYQAYLERHPGDAAIHVQLAHALKESGDLEGAAGAYRRALRLEPDAHEVRLHLAHCLKNAGALDAAVTEFSRLVADQAYSTEASVELCSVYAGLGDLFHRQGRLYDAVTVYSASVRLKADQPGIWEQLGHALKEAHRFDEAAAAYRTAASYAPLNPDPWLHLAHLLRITGPREDSVAAFARTWVLGNRSNHILEALRNAVGYREDEVHAAIERQAQDTGIRTDAYNAGLEPQKVHEASRADSEHVQEVDGKNIVYLSAVDWGYRRQRPQHMARALGAAGCNVFYVSTVFDQTGDGSGFSDFRDLADNVSEVRLRIRAEGGASIHYAMAADAVADAGAALAKLCQRIGPKPFIVIDHPAWFPICEAMIGSATIIYDCIDEISALPGTRPEVIEAERRLLSAADIVLASSAALLEKIPERRGARLVPNGVDTAHFAHFAQVAERVPAEPGVRILYFGMIADWFNSAWIDYAARAHPEWTFQLVGEVVTDEVAPLRQLPNVQFIGEVPYEQLPDYLRGASATVIPFHVNELTQAVNPVKVYEYLAAGRPVVASAMRELQGIPWVRATETPQAFEAALADEIAADTGESRKARAQWAAAHDWSGRARLVLDALHSHGAGPATKLSLADVEHDPFVPFSDFVLFVAPFPKPGMVVEGWMGRIRAVDEIFDDSPRIYLNFSLSADPLRQPDVVRHSPVAIEILVHPTSTLHASIVERAMNDCRFCYVQTVHLAKFVIGYYPTGKIITDFHGIVPEEEEMLGNPEAGRFYEGIECTIVHTSRHIVVVTQSMAEHLRSKYSSAQFEEIVLPIIVEYGAMSSTGTKSTSDQIKVIYSGGSQVWQNIDLMLDAISRTCVEAQYSVASHDYKVIREKAVMLGIADEIDFGVYTREQLPILYASADFGFVLRDDSPVNRVACPTKLTEYLEFGVIPIVKLSEIGDFARHGFEFVTVEDFVAGRIPARAERTRIIARNREVLVHLQSLFGRSAAQLKPLRLESRIPCDDFAGLPTCNMLGMMPWKREVYVFGASTVYVSQMFLRPYEAASFDLPEHAEGDLIRVVPMVGDYIAKIGDVAITVAGVSDVIPVVVHSRGRPLPEGDFFTSDAPFFEIKLSRPVSVKRLEIKVNFLDQNPVSPAVSRYIGDNSDRVENTRISIKSENSEKQYNMITKNVKK